ncbi:hypothetical protein M0R89_14045 [Halorussus limi]|uniref:Uncharacterized protein n=1 Tax=Halorussus limi TaxID=2938695 RepID=A0A8U0HRI5_9EURY|nr:hypothetical protein [Halorussus limi]UPV73655.1 hypothetical protein M0R89_14045 [Halorussus limi]
MFDWLFPNWSNPAALTALVVSKVLLNAALTAFVAESTRATSRSALLTAGLTVASTILFVSVLRGGAGITASYVEFLAQAVLLAVAGRAVYSTPSLRRRVAVPVFLGAISLALVVIPVYGEATVAP